MSVSVIMPVRNGGAHLAEAMRSVLEQRYGDFELLLIDDGSTDGAIAALPAEVRNDPRLRMCKSPGRGLVAALNYGLRQACRPLVARMDADDVSLPERFRAQIEFLARNPSIAVLGTQVLYIDAEGRDRGHVSHFPTAPAAVAEALWTRGCVIKHPSVMARREAILAVGGYRPLLSGAEDYDLWLRMAEHGKIANLTDVFVKYREHASQYSSGINLKQRFACDLAIYAAGERRAMRRDPFDGAVDAALLDWAVEVDEEVYPETLRRLRSAYRALSHFEGAAPASPSSASLKNAVWAAETGYLGGGRRFRIVTATRCARLAARRRLYGLFASAARISLRGGARGIAMLLGLRPAK